MSLSSLLHVLALCFVFICQNLTAKNDVELHRLFKRYNKPAVKVIKTIHGDEYSCVDFNNQPAFDQPLLHNRSYHFEMTFSPMHEQSTNISEESSSVFKNFWLNGEGCPIGTVPIRKYTKNQFIHAHKLFQKLYPTDDPLVGRFRSCVHTQNGPHTFYGTSATLNIFNYGVADSQYTSGYIILRAANDQFQFGWMINPALYGDDKTRLFMTTKVESTKCFNLMCGSYVHTNKDVPIEAILAPTTTRGAKQSMEIVAKIVKDPKSNTWQLYATNIMLGYWPNEGLKGLSGAAEYLEWGGEAYNPYALRGPGMGSGFFPEGKVEYDGYARQVTKYDQNGQGATLENGETESYADNSYVYKIQDGGNVDAFRGHIVYYGGPGIGL